ncbi:unnamed protein product [Phaeothamnion confervicola]
MRTFMIAYDLARPAGHKHAMATIIMSLGSSWARPLEQTWYVRSDLNETEIEARLAHLLDDEDGMIVQSVAEEGVMTNTQLRWFRQRRPAFELEQGGNVVAFPSVPQVAGAQAELPLAAAS